MKTTVLAASVASVMLATLAAPAFAQQAAPTVASEAKTHPRIAAAIREINEAIKYMEAAPHDFGGNKAKAIAESRTAVASLKLALAYRVGADAKKK